MAERRSVRIGGALALAGAISLVGCGGGGDDDTAEQFEDAFADLEDSGSEDGFGEEVEPKEPELVSVDLDLPRETTYVDATWTVDEVTYQGVGVDEFGVETPPAAVVSFTVQNTGEQAADMEMLADRLRLLGPDGNAIVAEYGTGGEGETVTVNGTASFEAAFPLDTGVEPEALEDYTFQIGLDGNVPALIPLSGEMAPSDYPLTLDGMPASVDGVILGNGTSVDTGDATLRAITAQVVLDWAGQRADDGTRFLVVNAEVHINNGSQAYIVEDDLGVSIDGLAQEQVDEEVPLSTADLSEGKTAAVMWVFVIPADGKEGVFHFGSQSEPGAKGGEFTLPTLP
jgi:hypothetical protein